MIKRSNDDIKTCLKYYIPIKQWNLNDWDKIIERCKEVENGIYQFKCSCYDLYFDEDLHPVTYDKMIVCERKENRVYYDFEMYMKYKTEPPIPIGHYDWENQDDWGD